MPPSTSTRPRRKVTSLERAQLLGIRTSRVSTWSRSRSFNYTLWAIIILLAIIIVNVLISCSKMLYQIDSHRIALRHVNPSLHEAATHNETSIDMICSSSGHNNNKWQEALDRQFKEIKNDARPSFAVVLTVNDGYWDFFMNWMRHFNKSLANKSEQPVLIVIAEDSIIYKKLESYLASETRGTVILPGYNDDNISAVFTAENYDSVAYKKLVSSRATHLLNLICSLRGSGRGINEENRHTGEVQSSKDSIITVYSDIDALWVKDPFPYLQSRLFGSDIASNSTSNNSTVAMYEQHQQPSYDILAAVDDHDYNNVRDYYCTGYLVITQSYASMTFLVHWEKELQSNQQLNQPIFNSLLRSSTLPMIRHGGLGEIEFAPGRLYFDEWVKRGDLLERQYKNATMVVHNNYIIGHDAKKSRFEQNGLWITT